MYDNISKLTNSQVQQPSRSDINMQACRFALILATHAKFISGKLSFSEISLSFWEIFLSFKKNSLLWRHCCYIGVPIFFRNIEFLKNILEFFEKIAWVLVFLEFFIAWVFFENAKRQAWRKGKYICNSLSLFSAISCEKWPKKPPVLQ